MGRLATVGEIATAVQAYADDVRARRFPAAAETYFAAASKGATKPSA